MGIDLGGGLVGALIGGLIGGLVGGIYWSMRAVWRRLRGGEAQEPITPSEKEVSEERD
jgi:hypothetical protein